MIAMLAFWWLALRPPLLFLLRGVEPFALMLASGGGASIAVEDSGDWSFRVPVEDVHQQDGKLVKVHSVEFTIPLEDVTLFTFSWPVFWAVMMAAPDLKANGRALLAGTAILAVVEPILLLMFVQIDTRAVLAQWHPENKTGLAAWLREYGTYLNNNVMPFLAPIALAVALHPGLRSLIAGSKLRERAGAAAAASRKGRG
ncbi:MAG TPA: hypothetical protein VKX39_17970 [Bryobacteraceae bacterium]|jgi:hypothetical protein|nr:hypothetical protein [Bryobacteraceae bacterium]